jgi:hypothetical protein
MARQSRVVLNRGRLDEVVGGLADGVFDVARAIGTVAASRAPYLAQDPDVPPLHHLEEVQGAMVYVAGKRTHEWSSGPLRPDKPRAVRVRSSPALVTAIVGSGFPGMLVETGTLHAGAQPFLTPSASEVIGSEARFLLSKAMARRLAGARSAQTFNVARRTGRL